MIGRMLKRKILRVISDRGSDERAGREVGYLVGT